MNLFGKLLYAFTGDDYHNPRDDDYNHSTQPEPQPSEPIYDILPTDPRRVQLEKQELLERLQNGEIVKADYSNFKDIILKLGEYEDEYIIAKVSRYRDSYGFEGGDGCYSVYLKMSNGNKEHVFYEKFGYNVSKNDSVYRPGKWEQYLIEKGNEVLNQQYKNIANSIAERKALEQKQAQKEAEEYHKNHSPINDSHLFT